MPSHAPETFLPFEMASHPYLYTVVPLAAPAHVHTPRQSNKACTNMHAIIQQHGSDCM